MIFGVGATSTWKRREEWRRRRRLPEEEACCRTKSRDSYGGGFYSFAQNSRRDARWDDGDSCWALLGLDFGGFVGEVTRPIGQPGALF